MFLDYSGVSKNWTNHVANVPSFDLTGTQISETPPQTVAILAVGFLLIATADKLFFPRRSARPFFCVNCRGVAYLEPNGREIVGAHLEAHGAGHPRANRKVISAAS